jgi:predicted ATPase/DNA-binding SARP family transcriptional activator
MEPLVKIYSLGTFTIQNQGTPITEQLPRKAQAIFVYLAANQQAYPRETIAELFWPEQNQERSMGSLRVTLTRLRDVLEPYLFITRQDIQFNSSSAYWFDAAQLDTELTIGHKELGQNRILSLLTAKRLEKAFSLYTGHFLTDFYMPECQEFEAWIAQEREWMRQRILSLMEAVVNAYYDNEKFAFGITVARRLLQLDPFREKAHQMLMRLLALTGDRAAAVNQYEQCRKVLNEELAVEPDPETQAIYEQIKEGKIVAVPEKPLRYTLPSPPTPFMGREKALAQIAMQLADSNCQQITICGIGGTGKTRLAIQAAQEQVNVFADGVYFVTLLGVHSEELLLNSIAESIGCLFPPQTDPKQHLLNYLKTKHMLIVLDNFEHLLDTSAFLSELMQACPNLKLIVTSRERLNIEQEWLFPIDGLDYPDETDLDAADCHDAVQLFVQTAQRLNVQINLDIDLPAIVRICWLVEGMPLAIELAASWLRTMTFAQIVEQLTGSLDILKTPSRSMHERHRSIRLVFEHSWAALSKPEQQVLMKLSVFRGGFSLNAASHVSRSTLEIIAALVDKSLVKSIRSGRYDLHGLLRQFAQEKLTEAGELEKTRLAHLTCFVNMCEEIEPRVQSKEQEFWLKLLEQDHANFRAALEWGINEYDDPTLAAKLAAALHWYWQLTVYVSEGQRWEEQALARLDPTESTECRAKLLYGTAALAWWHNDFNTAATRVMECLAIWRELNNKKGIAYALLGVGLSMLSHRQNDFARTALEECITLMREVKDTWGLSIALNNLGEASVMAGDAELAQFFWQQALAAARESGTEWAITVPLLAATINSDSYEQTRSQLESVLPSMQHVGGKIMFAISLFNLGRAALQQGNFQSAADYFKNSLKLYCEMEQQIGLDRQAGIIHCIGYIGIWLGLQKRFEESAVLFGVVENARKLNAIDLTTMDQNEHDKGLALLRTEMTPIDFNTAWTKGTLMSLAEAISYVETCYSQSKSDGN